MGVVDYDTILTLATSFYLLLIGAIGFWIDFDPMPFYIFGLFVLVPLLVHSMIRQYREMGGFRPGTER